MTECYFNCSTTKTFGYKRKASNKTYAGMFDLVERDEKYEIWSLGVKPRYRNKGYATQMLTEFISQFKLDKPLFLYVEKCNEIAIRLYKNIGFVITGEWSARDAYIMKFIERKE